MDWGDGRLTARLVISVDQRGGTDEDLRRYQPHAKFHAAKRMGLGPFQHLNQALCENA